MSAAGVARPVASQAAEAGGPWTSRGSVSVTTDYVDRGVSQSDRHASVQGRLELQHADGTFFAVSASSVDLDDGEATLEMKYIIGKGLSAGSLDYSVSVTLADYPGARPHGDYDLLELAVAGEYPLGRMRLQAEGVFTPRNAGDAGVASYLTVGAEVPLSSRLVGRARIGRQWNEDEETAGPDYLEWCLGLSWRWQKLRVSLDYTDTDAVRHCGGLCDGTLLATAALDF